MILWNHSSFSHNGKSFSSHHFNWNSVIFILRPLIGPEITWSVPRPLIGKWMLSNMYWYWFIKTWFVFVNGGSHRVVDSSSHHSFIVGCISWKIIVTRYPTLPKSFNIVKSDNLHYHWTILLKKKKKISPDQKLNLEPKPFLAAQSSSRSLVVRWSVGLLVRPLVRLS